MGDGAGTLAGARILFAVSALGLGHVQRSLPLLRHLLASGTRVEVVSHGRALEALRIELDGAGVERFHDLPDYPPLQRGRGLLHYLQYLPDLLVTWWRARAEAALLRTLHEREPFDAVIADGRIGFVHEALPSFFLAHQLRILVPPVLRPLQRLSDRGQLALLRRYTRVFVQDLPDPNASLAGALAHNELADVVKPVYIGPLSTLGPGGGAEAHTLVFVAGGFIEAERRRVVREVGRLVERMNARVGQGGAGPPRVAFLLGGGAWNPGAFPAEAELYPLALGEERRTLMAGARLWVGRTGYTTVMDVWAAGARAVLVPTPGMTEQRYLARRVAGWGHHPAPGGEADLVEPILRALAGAVYLDARQLPAPLRAWTPERSVACFAEALGRELAAHGRTPPGRDHAPRSGLTTSSRPLPRG
jgi:hypothetical protein